MEWKSKIQAHVNSNRRFPIRWKVESWRDGKLYYSINKKGSVKIGAIRLMPEFILEATLTENRLVAVFSGALLSASVLLTLALFAGQKGSYIEAQPGIGGGVLAESGAETHLHVEDIEITDEDFKNKVLGDDTELLADLENTQLVKRNYQVKSGDTLSAIALRYNVSVESIAGSSGIKILDHLQVGQELSIPSKEGFFYSVQKNDRLALILKKYKVEYDKFLAENHLVTPDLLEVGQEIFLPDAKPDNLVRSWLVPVASRIVTSSYGWRTKPRKAFHKGLDLKAPYVSVRAAKGGRVTYAGWQNGYGNVIIIAHPGGYKTLYGHLSKMYVKSGSYVAQGTVIGKSGNTGYSFGPHLHFEVIYKGKHINPATILVGLKYKR